LYILSSFVLEMFAKPFISLIICGTLWHKGQDLDCIRKKATEDIETIVEWTRKWRININMEKCAPSGSAPVLYYIWNCSCLPLIPFDVGLGLS
jgi:hypothetical protein